ncbi:MAG TPA: septum site-determining protein MinC [Trueperaceae bacterium]|nr:septum site-determining protein MinC [Trueperaceae bacterium]
MKARGTRGGILLSLEESDTPEAVDASLKAHAQLLQGKVAIEVAGKVPFGLALRVKEAVESAGGSLSELRPPTTVPQARGETVIVARTVRSGGRIESTGSVVVLGDVNAGAEIIANDDIIVVGTLRGLAHAGAGGNEKAVVWAERIQSPQLRIGSAVAQAGDDGTSGSGPEVAHLKEGVIRLRPWNS